MSELGYVISRALKKLRGSAVRDSRMHPTASHQSGCTLLRSSFGRYSYCGYDCTFIDSEVGQFCSIASRVTVGAARHPTEFLSTSPAFVADIAGLKQKFAILPYAHRPKTIIGHDVWIGENVMIKGGVTIGHGAVIGMGSIVTRDVAPYTIVAGNPARPIRQRFSPQVIDALLKFSWWDLPESELRRIGPLANRPEELLRQEGLL